jgi:hypothetical protein
MFNFTLKVRDLSIHTLYSDPPQSIKCGHNLLFEGSFLYFVKKTLEAIIVSSSK